MQQHTKNSSLSIPRSQPSSSKQANSTLVGTQDDNTSSSLLDGTYDETASAALFQQALAEWRNGGSGSVPSKNKETCSKGENTLHTKGALCVLRTCDDIVIKCITDNVHYWDTIDSLSVLYLQSLISILKW